MRVHHLPVRTSFRGTTDISGNFDCLIHEHDESRKRPRGGDTYIPPPQPVPVPNPTTAAEGAPAPSPLLVSHFRGRRLLGRVVTIDSTATLSSTTDNNTCGSSSPATRLYEGAVLLISAPPTSLQPPSYGDDNAHPSSSHRSVVVWDTFASFTSWEHDREPTAQDTTMITNWLDLSNDLHRCVGAP